jgi:hypothetical protein
VPLERPTIPIDDLAHPNLAPLVASLPNLTLAPDNEVRPAFEVARIEPSGDAVIAGRAAPGASVELLRDGKLHDRVVADKSGQFAMVPPLGTLS